MLTGTSYTSNTTPSKRKRSSHNFEILEDCIAQRTRSKTVSPEDKKKLEVIFPQKAKKNLLSYYRTTKNHQNPIKQQSSPAPSRKQKTPVKKTQTPIRKKIQKSKTKLKSPRSSSRAQASSSKLNLKGSAESTNKGNASLIIQKS